MENIKEAQLEMRNKHMYGATGVVVSGLMWLLSGLVAYNDSPTHAVWTLLVGGALIHPVSTVFNKILGVTGTASKDNALNNLAIEGTFFMLLCIPLAYGLSLQRTEWFFQSMLLIIGGRYLTFNTIYGNKLFWILGATLGVIAYVLFSLRSQSYISALVGSVIEISYGFFIYYNARKMKIVT